MPGGLVRLGTCFFRADTSAREALLDGSYEGPERFASRYFVDPALPVIEFGGSLGVVSCLLNRRLKNPPRHVVVEANPDNVPVLIENRNRNRCKFEVLHRAVGAGSGKVRLYLGDGALTSSSILPSSRSVEVESTTLACILQTRKFTRCALICDIEGAEIGLIESEIEVFRSCVDVFIVEFHPAINGWDQISRAATLLKQSGFRQRWQKQDVMVFEKQPSTPAAAPSFFS